MCVCMCVCVCICMHVCVMVLMGYMPAAPTIFHQITTHGHHSGRIRYFGFLNQSQPIPWAMQMAAPMATICIGPGNRLVPVSQVPTKDVHGATIYKDRSPWPLAHLLAEHDLGHI